MRKRERLDSKGGFSDTLRCEYYNHGPGSNGMHFVFSVCVLASWDFIPLFCVEFLMKRFVQRSTSLWLHANYNFTDFSWEQMRKSCKFELCRILARRGFTFIVSEEHHCCYPSFCAASNYSAKKHKANEENYQDPNKPSKNYGEKK